MILFNYTVTNGAILSAHRIVKVEITGSTAFAIINSFKDIYETQISWQDSYEVPLTAIADVEAWLVSPEGCFNGGLITSEEADPVDKAKRFKRAQINAWRNEKQWAGVVTPSGTFDSDPESQRLLNGAVVMAQIALANSQPFEIGWTMKNNVTITLDALQLIEGGMLVGQHISICHATARQLKLDLDAAQTVEEIEAIVWPSE